MTTPDDDSQTLTTQSDDADQRGEPLAGQRVAFLGKLAGMARRDAQRLVRKHGGTALDKPEASASLVVVGEEELPLGDLTSADLPLDAELREAAERGTLEIITETQLWQRLGLVDAESSIRQLYTPGMLAHLLSVPVSVVRRWHRRGLIVPVREVRRLPYFDFQEVATARRLAELLAAGCSPQTIEKKLAALGKYLPGVERPLVQLSVIVEGRELLLRQGDGLIEPGGQLRFDFESPEPSAPHEAAGEEAAESIPLTAPPSQPSQLSPAEMFTAAADLEDQGQLEPAAEMYRATLAATGPDAEVSFALAELLYRLGDLPAARERYFSAIEIDEDYVEARANLGCVLVELGQRELAVEAFRGALAFHGQYPDAHYHLARTLDELDRDDEAAQHWSAFLGLAPTSPWADEARARLERE